MPMAQMGEYAEPFKDGDRVEVSLEKDGAYGVWFPATVLKYFPDDHSYLVRYWCRKDGAEDSPQKLTVSSQQTRPQPPSNIKSFKLFDTVDAYYDFAWNTGEIIKDFKDKNFMVSFKRTENKMVLNEAKLRPHVEWIDGRWIDASQARVDDNDNDKPHSRPLRKSNSENPEVPPLAVCNAVKEAKKSKRDPSGQPNTPAYMVRQNDTAAPERPCTVLFSETDTSIGDKVSRVATSSTACDTDVTKAARTNKQNASKEPKTPIGPVCQTNAAAYKKLFSSETEGSLGDKVSKAAAAEVSPLATCKTAAAKATTRSNGDAYKEPKTPITPVCRSNATTPKRYTRSRVDDNDVTLSKLQKISKSESASGITTFSARKAVAATETTIVSEQNPPQELMTPTLAATLTGPVKVSSLETPNPVDEMVNKGENVKGLKKDTARSSKRKGKPSKFCPLSTEGVRTAEVAEEKGCEAEHISPIILVVPQIGKNGPDAISCGFGKEGSQASISVQNGKGNGPSGLVIEAKGENVKDLENGTAKRRGRPPNHRSSTGDESNAGIETAEDAAGKVSEIEHIAPAILFVANIEGSQTSISDQNGKGNGPAGVIEETPQKNQSEMSLGLLAPMEISMESCEKADMDIDNVNPSLPFVRTAPVWDALESLDVFKSLPQKPHFHPLESIDEEHREGLALGHMMAFLKTASKIPVLQLDTPRSSVKSSLESLIVLEKNGFDVKFVRECFNDWLLKKDKMEQLQNDLKLYGNEISEYKNKKAETDKVVEEYDKLLEEIRAKRDLAVLEREVQESGLARCKFNWDDTNKRMKAIESDLKKLAALPARK